MYCVYVYVCVCVWKPCGKNCFLSPCVSPIFFLSSSFTHLPPLTFRDDRSFFSPRVRVLDRGPLHLNFPLIFSLDWHESRGNIRTNQRRRSHWPFSFAFVSFKVANDRLACDFWQEPRLRTLSIFRSCGSRANRFLIFRVWLERRSRDFANGRMEPMWVGIG